MKPIKLLFPRQDLVLRYAEIKTEIKKRRDEILDFEKDLAALERLLDRSYIAPELPFKE